MKILVDTNVVLDVCFEREQFQEPAKRIFSLIERKQLKGCLSATAMTDIYYMARRQFRDRDKALWTIKRLTELFNVLKADEKAIRLAVKLNWRDFEDCVQYAVAKRAGVRAIITRNKKDYSQATIPVYTPADFLAAVR